MMHGYGYGHGAGEWMMSSSSLFNGTGWMVISMMGIGFLLIVGLIAWFVWTQRQSLGLTGPQMSGQQPTYANFSGFQSPSTGPAEAVEQIARRRYVSGEIDGIEFKAIMATLKEQ